MKVRRIEIGSIDTTGHVHKMTVWVNLKALNKLQRSDTISLKNQDPEVQWRILRRFEIKEMGKDHVAELKRKLAKV